LNDLRVRFPKPCSERWEEMRREGCNRFCGQCEKTIHNLSEMTLEEAEVLLRSSQDACVQATLNPGGEIVLKHGRSKNGRRMIVAAGASMSLLAAACQTTTAPPPKGVISGKVETGTWVKSVSAKGENGRVFHAKVEQDGSYAFKPLPLGNYSLKFLTGCGTWVGDTVVLHSSELKIAEIMDPNDCIIVGQIMLEDVSGQAG
jgi:hypothetical protein